jgi:hypothetical protein
MPMYLGDDHGQFVGVAPRPILVRLDRPDDGMTASVGVGRGMVGGRVVAAAHMAALQANAKVKPWGSRGKAVDAAVDRVWQLLDSDVVQMRAGSAHTTKIRSLR